ncbi:spore coat protein U domain-containing protein [Rhodanobacter sp. MP1X3]|uniref:spore coat protein U domain-containing protein n=1 Tax=Rhodanobacter sp. MP1X3 TaxID=2723086 RepID=UPI0016188D68|nr:spore coat protein U domain-containing protein [Rhodanobacter sp. MP1X3]MBB6243430.1 spore coat protein U-like protein [Rhodanobacter sp. MP1X3]
MSIKNTLRAVAFAVLVGVAASANAANPATATFQVLITITKACTVTAGTASNINLGSVAGTAVNTTNSNTISVNCSKTTPYYVGLAPSNANTAGAGTMVSTTAPATNTDKVPYQLTSTAGAGGTIWGNTATSTAVGNGVAGTGTGVAQSLTVYATAASANFTPDSYADTVTVNVNY